MYSINFTVSKKKFCLSLHYNRGNISKDWSADNMKKTRFNGYVYDFNVNYDATDVDDIVDIHKYLMKKNNSVNKNT